MQLQACRVQASWKMTKEGARTSAAGEHIRKDSELLSYKARVVIGTAGLIWQVLVST